MLHVVVLVLHHITVLLLCFWHSLHSFFPFDMFVRPSRAFRHSCQAFSNKKVKSQKLPAFVASRSLRRCLSSAKAPKEEEEIKTAARSDDTTPNIIYYGLYATFCYSGVYVGTLATLYMGLSNGMVSAETFDIDQIESVAKVTILYYSSCHNPHTGVSSNRYLSSHSLPTLTLTNRCRRL